MIIIQIFISDYFVLYSMHRIITKLKYVISMFNLFTIIFIYSIKTDKYNKYYFYFYDKERNDSMAKE